MSSGIRTSDRIRLWCHIYAKTFFLRKEPDHHLVPDRKAEPSDIPGFIEIDAVVPLDPERTDYFTEVVSGNEAWVCVIDEDIAGYAVLYRFFDGDATIDMLMINIRRRRFGIGTALLRHMERICD